MPKYMLVVLLNTGMDVPCMFFDNTTQFLQWGSRSNVPVGYLRKVRKGNLAAIMLQPKKWEKGQHPVFTSYIHSKGELIGYMLKLVPEAKEPFTIFVT